jgi:hypothetical protein
MKNRTLILALLLASATALAQPKNRLLGRDERLAVRSLYEGLEFLYRLVKALAS